MMFAPFIPHAQERAAGGAVDTQMTWSALSTQINGVSVKADAVNSRVDQAVVCGRLGKVYAPGATGADANGCLSAQYVNSIVNCGNQGRIYNSASNSCVIPGEIASIIACGNQQKVYQASTNSCVEVAGGTRWVEVGPGPAAAGSDYGQLGRYKQRLAGMGYPECSGRPLGVICPTKNAYCATFQSESRTCGTTGGSERTCTTYSSTAYRCN